MTDQACDPVFSALLKSGQDEHTASSEPSSRVASGLAIDLRTRNRLKLMGKMAVGSAEVSGSAVREQHDARQNQLFMKVEQSVGKCHHRADSFISLSQQFPQQTVLGYCHDVGLKICVLIKARG